MTAMKKIGAFHYRSDVALTSGRFGVPDASSAPANVEQFSYAFKNFFHPFVGALIQQLNSASVSGMLDPQFVSGLKQAYKFPDDYPQPPTITALEDKDIDLTIGGPYSNYNWELFYHIPVMVAVHLSNNQRFAEAEKWFHYVFDPTAHDTTVAVPQRFWKFLPFRNPTDSNPTGIQNINTLLQLLRARQEISAQFGGSVFGEMV